MYQTEKGPSKVLFSEYLRALKQQLQFLIHQYLIMISPVIKLKSVMAES